jgi:hypothetical protein
MSAAKAPTDNAGYGKGRRSSWVFGPALVVVLALLLVILVAFVPPPLSPIVTPPGNGFHPTPFTGPTLVGFATSTTCVSKSNVTSATLGTTTASTDSVVVFVEMASTLTVAGVSSSVGTDHYVKDGSATNTGNAHVEIWSTSDAGAGSTYKVSVSSSSAGDYCVQAAVFSGSDLFTTIDAIGSGTGATNTSCGDSVTSRYANEIVAMACAVKTTSTSETLAQQGSWVIGASNMATNGIGGGTVTQAIASASAQHPEVTVSTSLSWEGLAVAINNTGAPHTAGSIAVAASTSAHETFTITRPTNRTLAAVSNYTVRNGAAGGSCGTQMWSTWTSYLGGTSTSGTVTGLSPATDYCYSVIEWNATGRGPAASTVTAYTVPAQTTSFTCPTVTLTTFACSWTNSASGSGGASNVSMYYFTGSACSGTATGLSLGVVTSKTVAGLAGATEYSVEIADWSPAGTGPVSACVHATTLAGTVTGLSVGSISTTGFTASWTNPAGTIANDTVATTATSCTGTWSYISLGASGTSQVVTGLASATKYCVAVLAWSSSGTSGPAFTNGTTIPTAPTSLMVGTPTTSSLIASWLNPGGALVNDSVYRWVGSSCSGSVTTTSLGAASTVSSQTALVEATAYSFEVAAWSSGGTSAVSSCVTAFTIPTNPTGLAVASVTTTSISFSWLNPGGAIVNNTFYRWAGTSCSGTVAATSLGFAGTSSTQSGLGSATSYSVEVVAWSNGGSSAVTYCQIGTTLPTKTTLLTVTATASSSVSLSWTNPGGGSLVNSTVAYTLTACTGSWAYISIGSVVTSKTVTGLATHTAYCFAVQAASSGGQSAPEFVNGTTSAGSVSSPINLVVTAITASSVTLGWQNPNPLTGNVVLYGASCTAPSRNLTITVSVRFTVGSLNASTSYCFSVGAVNNGTYSGLSNSVFAVTTGAGGGGGGQGNSPSPNVTSPLPLPPPPSNPTQAAVEGVGLLFIVLALVALFRKNGTPWGAALFGVGIVTFGFGWSGFWGL